MNPSILRVLLLVASAVPILGAQSQATPALKGTRQPISLRMEIDGVETTLHIDGKAVTLESSDDDNAPTLRTVPSNTMLSTQEVTQIRDRLGAVVATLTTDPYGVQLRFAARSERPWIGVDLQAAPPVLAEQLDLDVEQVSIVAGIREDSPAARSGLRVHDVVTAVDGQPVANTDQLRQAIAKRKPGDSLPVTVIRKGEAIEVEIEVGRATLPSPGDLSRGDLSLVDLLALPAGRYQPVSQDVATSYTRLLAGPAAPNSKPAATTGDSRLAGIEQRLTNIEALLEKLTKDRKNH